jgi:hypothetical protein
MELDWDTGFLIYRTTPEDIEQMHVEYKRDFEKSNKLNSKTVYDKKESRLAGIIGEIAFKKFTGIHGERFRNRPEDNIFYGRKWDVKCKYRSIPPRLEFEASEFTYQNNEYSKAIEYYAFLSTVPEFRLVWFCSWASHNDWWHNSKGKLWQKGDKDPTNGKIFDENTWSVFYKDMKKFKFHSGLLNI